jgi:hypothetical protein
MLNHSMVVLYISLIFRWWIIVTYHCTNFLYSHFVSFCLSCNICCSNPVGWFRPLCFLSFILSTLCNECSQSASFQLCQNLTKAYSNAIRTHTHTYMHTYIHIHIYIYMCVCVWFTIGMGWNCCGFKYETNPTGPPWHILPFVRTHILYVTGINDLKE